MTSFPISACSWGPEAVYNENVKYVFKAKLVGVEVKEKTEEEKSNTYDKKLINKAYYTFELLKTWYGDLTNVSKLKLVNYEPNYLPMCDIYNLKVGSSYVFYAGKDLVEGLPTVGSEAQVNLLHYIVEQNRYDIEDSDLDSIPKDTWGNKYQWAMLDLQYRKVINGYSDGTFRPNEFVTREQLAKFVVNNFSLILDESGSKFPDRIHNLEFDKYIQTLKNKNIIAGYSDGQFHGDRFVTREQAAKFVVNSTKLVKPDLFERYSVDTTEIKDVDLNNKFYNEIVLLEKRNIVEMYSLDYFFRPTENITRGELSGMLSKAYVELQI